MNALLSLIVTITGWGVHLSNAVLLCYVSIDLDALLASCYCRLDVLGGMCATLGS